MEAAGSVISFFSGVVANGSNILDILPAYLRREGGVGSAAEVNSDKRLELNPLHRREKTAPISTKHLPIAVATRLCTLVGVASY